jgi:hypothetical protein
MISAIAALIDRDTMLRRPALVRGAAVVTGRSAVAVSVIPLRPKPVNQQAIPNAGAFPCAFHHLLVRNCW